MRRILFFAAIASILLGSIGSAIALTILPERGPRGHYFVALDVYKDSPSKACMLLYPSMTKFDANICGLVAMARKQLTREKRINQGTVLEFSDTRTLYAPHAPDGSPKSKAFQGDGSTQNSKKPAALPDKEVKESSNYFILWCLLWGLLFFTVLACVYMAAGLIDERRKAARARNDARLAKSEKAKLERSEGSLWVELVQKNARILELTEKLNQREVILGGEITALKAERKRLRDEVDRLEERLRKLVRENHGLRFGPTAPPASVQAA